MLFREEFLDGIRAGTVTLAYRRWRRPTVRTGGSLLTPIGQLAIEAVEAVAAKDITEAEARSAGYPSRSALLEELARRTEGDLYRIALGALRADPRTALRMAPAKNAAEANDLEHRLQRMDRAAAEPWTFRTLEIVGAHPGVRAGDLCALLGQEKLPFKANVRKLKNLGLTESLTVGYRLSPRGEALLHALRRGR